MARKIKRLPGAPKPPLNSYMEFFKEERVRVMAEGTVSTMDISKIIGERWRTLNVEEKKIYVDRSNHNRAVYEEEKRAFMSKCEDDNDPSNSDDIIPASSSKSSLTHSLNGNIYIISVTIKSI